MKVCGKLHDIVPRRHCERVPCTLLRGLTLCVSLTPVNSYRFIDWHAACGVCVAHMMEYVLPETIASIRLHSLCAKHTYHHNINDGWTVWLGFSRFFSAVCLLAAFLFCLVRNHFASAFGFALAGASSSCYLAIFVFLLNIYVCGVFSTDFILLESFSCRRMWMMPAAGIPKFAACGNSVAHKTMEMKSGDGESAGGCATMCHHHPNRNHFKSCICVAITQSFCSLRKRIFLQWSWIICDAVQWLCVSSFLLSLSPHLKINTYRTCATEWLTDSW